MPIQEDASLLYQERSSSSCIFFECLLANEGTVLGIIRQLASERMCSFVHFRAEKSYPYTTLHACCVADTNLHMSLSTCSTSVTDGRPTRFHRGLRFGIFLTLA